jgi:hypothetical protein
MRLLPPTISARLDPGWLYVAAGVAMAALVVLVPTHRDLSHIRSHLARLEADDAKLGRLLAAHAALLTEVETPDEALVRRLAALQLNLVRDGEQPVLLARETPADVTAWIDRAVAVAGDAGADAGRIGGPRPSAAVAAAAGHTLRRTPVAGDPRPADCDRAAAVAPDTGDRSWLERVATGRARLWCLGAAAMVVFIGLLLGPSRAAPKNGTRFAAGGAGEGAETPRKDVRGRVDNRLPAAYARSAGDGGRRTCAEHPTASNETDRAQGMIATECHTMPRTPRAAETRPDMGWDTMERGDDHEQVCLAATEDADADLGARNVGADALDASAAAAPAGGRNACRPGDVIDGGDEDVEEDEDADFDDDDDEEYEDDEDLEFDDDEEYEDDDDFDDDDEEFEEEEAEYAEEEDV